MARICLVPDPPYNPLRSISILPECTAAENQIISIQLVCIYSSGLFEVLIQTAGDDEDLLSSDWRDHYLWVVLSSVFMDGD